MSNEALAVAVQNGDHDALAQLWEQVKDYAYTVVMRYKEKTYAETEDYLQTAFLGVREAALAFDPSRGSFLTVADWYIRRACRAFYNWNRQGEIQAISYDVPYNPENPDDGDYKDLFPDPTIPPPSERLEREDMARDVRRAINELPPRFQDIIRERYYQGKSMHAVGVDQGLSYQRISQIEKAAFKRLQRSKHILPYKRFFAPYTGVGVGAFRRLGGSVVEYIAIKNVDAELRAKREAQRAEYLDYVRHVMDAVQNGWISLPVGWNMVEDYKQERGML